jgi:hypothetical protein
MLFCNQHDHQQHHYNNSSTHIFYPIIGDESRAILSNRVGYGNDSYTTSSRVITTSHDGRYYIYSDNSLNYSMTEDDIHNKKSSVRHHQRRSGLEDMNRSSVIISDDTKELNCDSNDGVRNWSRIISIVMNLTGAVICVGIAAFAA